MNNLFTWCHGPLTLEILTPEKPHKETVSYTLKLHNTSNGYVKEVNSTDMPQLNHLQECFKSLNSKDFKKFGCLVDSLTIPNNNNQNIIKSFRDVYRTIVTTDEENLGTHYIEIVRHDYNFKHSEFEPEKTNTTYSLVFGFPDIKFPSYIETFEVRNLDFSQISVLVDNISTLIN